MSKSQTAAAKAKAAEEAKAAAALQMGATREYAVLSPIKIGRDRIKEGTVTLMPKDAAPLLASKSIAPLDAGE